MGSLPDKLLVLNEAMNIFIWASCRANGFQSARKSSSFWGDEVEDGLREQGPFGLWSNSLIMLHQTVFESMFSCVVFIKISFWSSVVKTFRKKFKFPTECIHHEHNKSSNVKKTTTTILPVCSILLVQMVEVVLLGSDPDLHLLFSIKSLRERIEIIISSIFSLASILMSLSQKTLLWLCTQRFSWIYSLSQRRLCFLKCSNVAKVNKKKAQ